MPNGRPGDHPYTDIVVHDSTIYNEAIRKYAKRIDDYDETGATGRAQSLMWGVERNPGAAELEALEAELAALVDEIEQSDRYPGDSPLETVVGGDETLYNESLRGLIRDIHAEMAEEIDNTRRGRRKLSDLLWEFGWEPTDPDMFESALREFRANHWVWEK